MKLLAVVSAVFAALVMLKLAGCARDVDRIKAEAPAKWQSLGFTVLGYEGYQWSLAGGDVWHLLKREDSPGVLFSGYMNLWGDELQVWGPRVVSGEQINLTEKEGSK